MWFPFVTGFVTFILSFQVKTYMTLWLNKESLRRDRRLSLDSRKTVVLRLTKYNKWDELMCDFMDLYFMQKNTRCMDYVVTDSTLMYHEKHRPYNKSPKV